MSSDNKFSKDFAKAIAQALLEKEQQSHHQNHHDVDGNAATAASRNHHHYHQHHPNPRTSTTTSSTTTKEHQWQAASNAYQALCFDDPRVESDDACRWLAHELLQTRLALSERFVEGLRQATSRFQIQLTTISSGEQGATAATTTATEATGSLVPEDMGLVTAANQSSATAVGYAILASVVFAEIPLKCCQAGRSDLKQVQSLLGSYRGPQHQQERETAIEERLTAMNLQREKESNLPTCSPSEGTDLAHDDDDHEVWAEESDPSDFVYESNANVDWTAWEMAEMDPIELSKPIHDDDWPQVQCAVANLLQDLTHDKFVPFNATMWKKQRLSETLTQLALVLLVGSGPGGNDGTDIHQMSESLKQKLSIQPLNVLRDRVLMHRNDSRSLQDYLSLVQSLIAVDTAQEDPKASVAYASMVGLASLSSICSQAKSLKEIPAIRKCVLACCEDLCSLIERASVFPDPAAQATSVISTIAAQQTLPQWVSMIWAFLPLLEVLANIHADGTTLDTSRYCVPAADPQWLLNSGLFRALIMLYTKTAPYSSLSVAVDPARHQLLQCLQMLSLQSMSLLGKYAWRVPDLNALIHQDDYQCNNVVDSMVWSLMGQQLAGGTVMRLRTAKTITCEECKALAVRQWCHLHQQVLGAIQMIGELRSKRQHGISSNGSAGHVGLGVDSENWKHSITELARFANCLVSCDALPQLWRQAMDQEKVQEQISCLQKVISDLPPPPPPAPKATTTSKTSDDDKVGDPLERPDPSFEVEVGMVRKAIKVATICLQEQADDAARRGVASKTD